MNTIAAYFVATHWGAMTMEAKAVFLLIVVAELGAVIGLFEVGRRWASKSN